MDKDKTKAAIEEAAEQHLKSVGHENALADENCRVDFKAGAQHVIENPKRHGLTSLRLDQPWPLKDILAKLVEAADTLLIEYSYDVLHYEEINSANNEAKKILEELK